MTFIYIQYYNFNIIGDNMNDQIYNNQQSINSNYNNTNVDNNSNKKLIIISIATFIVVFSIVLSLLLFINRGKSRTVMIYMVGSNLESDAGLGTVDLQSINYNTAKSEDVNVVLIAGGSEKWHNDFVSTNETSIFELQNTGFKKVKEQSVQNMGDDKAFSDFLTYTYQNYKSDEYELVFWNHGGAIFGSEFDDLSNDNLSLKEISEGLYNSPFKENKLETIIFRTCLNGTVEVASVLKDYSNYLVASEEVTLGSNRSSVLNFINDIKKSDSSYNLSMKYINAYQKQISDIKASSLDTIYSTYSIIDLAKVDELVKSINDFVRDIDVSKNYNSIAKVRSNLYQYAYTQSDEPSYDMVDLYNMVYELKDLSKTKAQKVLDNINNTVLYNWATNDQSRGMSIYFPFNGSNEVKQSFLSIYKDLNEFQDYNQFINKFYSLQNSSTTSFSFFDNKVSFNTEDSKRSGDFELELTDEQLSKYARAEYIVFRDGKDGMYIPTYRGRTVNLDGKTLKAKIKDRLLKVYDTKEKDEGTSVILIENEETDDYIKYKSSVLLEYFKDKDISNWKTDAAWMNLVYNKKTKKITISNVVKNDKKQKKPSAIALNYKDYDNVVFSTTRYKILDDNGDYTTNWTNNGISEGYEVGTKQFAFKLQDFGNDDNYYCIFVIYDTNNNVYYSKLVKMS